MGSAREMAGKEGWQASGFGCFSNIGNCMMGWCCPCVLYGKTNDILEENTCLSASAFFCCLTWCTICCYAPGRRERMREVLNLPAAPCNDCIFWVCCPHCANCQEANELAARGITKHNEWASSVATHEQQKGKAAAA